MKKKPLKEDAVPVNNASPAISGVDTTDPTHPKAKRLGIAKRIIKRFSKPKG